MINPRTLHDSETNSFSVSCGHLLSLVEEIETRAWSETASHQIWNHKIHKNLTKILQSDIDFLKDRFAISTSGEHLQTAVTKT